MGQRRPIDYRRQWLCGVLAAALLVVSAGCGREPQPAAPAAAPFVVGLILVEPTSDHGWSQAEYEAMRRVEATLPNVKLIVIDNVNPGAKPGVTIPQLAEQMIAQGAQLIITGSDDFKDGTTEAARRHPEVFFINASGDVAWPAGHNYQPLPNLANVMGRMEFGEAIAGYAAALATQTGKIGYLGPLINDETRRLANATWLGALRAWTDVRGRDPRELTFTVKWIGFWFNIPGQTLDPTRVSEELFAGGYDVVISGLDTTEALVKAGQLRRAGKQVWAIPYNFRDGCAEAPDAALGVPYFNWYPMFRRAVEQARSGARQPYFVWDGPEWRDINSADSSSVGFVRSAGMSNAQAAQVERYTRELAQDPGALFRGPLNYQDGSVMLAPGETASDTQIWYQPQLLAGMTGASK